LNVFRRRERQTEAIALFERYTSLEPYDSRAFRDLADAYDTASEPVKAEAAYRKTIEINPAESDGYLRLIDFLILQDRIGEVAAVLVTADKQVDDETDVFSDRRWENSLISRTPSTRSSLLASEPSRMKTSGRANLALGQVHLDNRRYVTALQLFNVAHSSRRSGRRRTTRWPSCNRKQFRWVAALESAETGTPA
jgi:tetratricopeptide (TPR) repeat protein